MTPHGHRSTYTSGLVTATELAEISGASYKQIHYWTSQGYLTPAGGSHRNGGSITGSGSQRMYSLADVTKARLLRDLLDPVLMARAAVDLADLKTADLPGGFTIRLMRWSGRADRPGLAGATRKGGFLSDTG